MGVAEFGFWLGLPSPEVAEIVAGTGFDFVIIDLEHGGIGIETAARMLMALATSPRCPSCGSPRDRGLDQARARRRRRRGHRAPRRGRRHRRAARRLGHLRTRGPPRRRRGRRPRRRLGPRRHRLPQPLARARRPDPADRNRPPAWRPRPRSPPSPA